MKFYVTLQGVNKDDEPVYAIECSDYAEVEAEPDYVAVFPVEENQSLFLPRYSFNGTQLVDNYEGMSDEEVAAALHEAEAAAAAALIPSSEE